MQHINHPDYLFWQILFYSKGHFYDKGYEGIVFGREHTIDNLKRIIGVCSYTTWPSNEHIMYVLTETWKNYTKASTFELLKEFFKRDYYYTDETRRKCVEYPQDINKMFNNLLSDIRLIKWPEHIPLDSIVPVDKFNEVVKEYWP